ncbi:MAG: transporter substrate-binding domain-containing protein [Cyanobium sp.]
MPQPSSCRPRRWPRLRVPTPWRVLPLLAALGLMGAVLAPAAEAETVVERAARTGVITIGTRTNLIPYAYVDDKQQLVGVSVDAAERIAREVSNYLQKPVRLEYRPVPNNDTLYRMVNAGEVDLACGIPFTWQQEMVVDYTVPFSLSGIRLLTKGGMKASPEALVGKRIGVIPGSLGEATIRTLQPGAVRLPQKDLETGVAAVIGGRLDAMAGDSIMLAGALLPMPRGSRPPRCMSWCRAKPTAAMRWAASCRRTIPPSAIWPMWPSSGCSRAIWMTILLRWLP